MLFSFSFCCKSCSKTRALYVSATKVSSPHLNRLRRMKERYFKNGQIHHISYINEQISDEIERISSRTTRRLFAFSNPKDAWNILKQLTGERSSYNANDERSLDELNASFMRGEPFSLPMSTAPLRVSSMRLMSKWPFCPSN